MPPDLRDASYVWDILEEARHVLEFTAGLTFEALPPLPQDPETGR